MFLDQYSILQELFRWYDCRRKCISLSLSLSLSLSHCVCVCVGVGVCVCEAPLCEYVRLQRLTGHTWIYDMYNYLG